MWSQMLGEAGLAERCAGDHGEAVRHRPRQRARAQRDRPRGLRRGADLPHRPLPRQGGGAEHPRAALRQRPLRADLEPQPHRPHPDRRARDARGRRARPASTRRPAPSATWSSPTCSRCSRFVAMEPPTALAPGAISRGEEQGLPLAAAARPRRRSCAASTRAIATSRASPRTRRPRRSSPCAARSTTGAGPGVPFFLRTGKRHGRGRADHLDRVPRAAAEHVPGRLGGRRATGRTTSPSTSTSPRASRSPSTASGPGRGWRSTSPACSSRSPRSDHGDDTLEAYERLIRDAMAGDHTLFTDRRRASSGCGRSPSRCCERPARGASRTPQGSWGPTEIRDLIAPHGWRLPFERRWREAKVTAA